ncbi:MAG TPA: response regulator [Nitrospirota bacterium]|nr:response regulator [Nitrospirota bacterium]
MGTETILVVDDDEDILELIERHLSNRGYEVLTAYDGEQAISLLDQLMFDLVITDLKMPKLDGMEVLRKAKEKDPNIEVVILTGHGTMDSVVEALRDGGAFDYLQKPLHNIKQLSFVTKKALERKRLRLENQKLLEKLNDTTSRLREKMMRVSKDLAGVVHLVSSSSDKDIKNTVIPSLDAIIAVIQSEEKD